MQTLSEFKIRLWIKYAFLMIGLSIFYSLGYYFINRIAGKTIVEPIFIIAGGILIALLLPLAIKIYAPSKIITNDDYNAQEIAFEKQGEDLIVNYLDPKIYERLYIDALNLIPNEGIQLCKEILDRSDVQNNSELQFYFLAKLSKYYFNNGEYNNAISSLKEAISIKPDNFIANMRLAELYERVGFADNAILHYETALRNSEIISFNLREFVTSQIQTVKTKGPRKKEPPDGFKWMTG